MRRDRDGAVRTAARVDDPFHGFEVALRAVDGVVVDAEATAHRAPWTTCPGALGSVARLAGQRLTDARRTMFAAPRAQICVHVNDLVVLAAAGGGDRRYAAVVERRRARLDRDGAPALDWPLVDYRVAGGAYAGLAFRDPRWPGALDAAGADAAEREAVAVLRRAVSVAMGYHELDWAGIRVAADVHAPSMPDSCHTFSTPRIADAACLVEPPRRAR